MYMLGYFLSLQATSVCLVLTIIMFFFCLVIYQQNKLLKLEIEKLKEEQLLLTIERNNVNEGTNTVSIKDISVDNMSVDKKNCIKESVKGSRNLGEDKADVLENSDKKDSLLLEKEVVLKIDDSQTKINGVDNKKKDIKLSSMWSAEIEEEKNNYFKDVVEDGKRVLLDSDKKEVDFDLSDFVKKREEAPKKINVKSNSIDYLKKLSERLEDEIKNQTVTLTDYEKDQEDNAIISYEELLKLKKESYFINDKDETVDFIEELKSFRNSLN